MSTRTKRVVIVGGGIAGLSTAYYLQERVSQTGEQIECTLIESRTRFGGNILTEQVGGFVVEGGPDSFLSQRPWARELCQQLGLTDRLIHSNDEQRRIYVLCKGRLLELTEGFFLMVPIRLMPFLRTPLISLKGKMRMALDLFLPRRREEGDETVADFVRRRLGREALEKIAEPLLAGIYAGDPEKMSLKSTFPRFFEIEREYGSLIRGLFAERKRIKKSQRGGSPARRSQFMTLRGGLGELVEALVSRLDRVSLISGKKVLHIRPRSGDALLPSSYLVHGEGGISFPADVVVLATPPYVTADILEGLDSSLADRLREIPYVSTATVSLGYKKSGFSHPLDGFGFVVPRTEGRQIMACTWTSTKFPHRAPEGSVLLRCFIGGAMNEKVALLDEGSMVHVVRDELREIMGITEAPVLARVYRWERANPQYLVGHCDRLAVLEKSLSPFPGLFLTGSGYRGVGIPDCIHDGLQTAERVRAYLT